jgi:hypothetical protein
LASAEPPRNGELAFAEGRLTSFHPANRPKTKAPMDSNPPLRAAFGERQFAATGIRKRSGGLHSGSSILLA